MPLPDSFRAHLNDVFRWSDEARFDRRRLLVSLLAMAVPVIVGSWLGRPTLGYVIGLGAMLLSSEPGEGKGAGHGSPLGALLPALLAVGVAMGVARFAWADVAMVVLAALAATLVNYSRPAAIAGIRFVVFLVLNIGLMGAHGPHGRGAALMFGVGAAWRVVLRLFVRPKKAPAEAKPVREPTREQRRKHLKRMLKTLQGWQYPIRLALGLGIACALRDLWPAHHFDWMVLSVVLLTPRALEHFPVHITQRAIGTLLGVALAGGIVYAAPGHIEVAVLVCLLGAVAPLLRPGNYAAYCILSTPLILLAVGGDALPGPSLLADRLIATLASSVIVLGANLLLDAMGAEPGPIASRS